MPLAEGRPGTAFRPFPVELFYVKYVTHGSGMSLCCIGNFARR